MKRIVTVLFFGLSLLLSGAGVSYSADFQKGLEAYNKDDFATAFREWSELAEQGNADAQYNLGVMYRKGEGVPQDYKEAVNWYRKSADQGYASAQYFLGSMYATGRGVLQDNIYAHMWFNIAASNGDADGAKRRGIAAKIMTASDLSKAQELARECVAKNYKRC
jgi:TPR repeat protein